jgi:uncharacterized protein YecT (DUF1311 family)
MIDRHHLCTQLFRHIPAIFVGVCALATVAACQTETGKLPAECSAYESIRIPAEAEKTPVPKDSPACASYRSYRGIGRPVNYAEARACAWQERLGHQADFGQNQKEPTAWVVGGSLILADIYFNGSGVKRDVPLAMHFACEFEKSTAELAFSEIAKSKDLSPGHGPFEFCDYAATTFTENFCISYSAQIEDDRRSRYYSSLKSSMTREQQKAFEKLFTAQNAYIEAHDREVDQGGTIRTFRTISSENILKDLFRTEVVHFESRRWPALSAKQIASADDVLHRAYEAKVEELSKQTKESLEQGAVSADNLSKAEGNWERYREAWVEFARLRYPGAVEAIRAEITLRRCSLIKTIYAY